MPLLDGKIFQQDLEKGQLWPFYWIYGPESYKMRETLHRIRSALVSSSPSSPSNALAREISFEGATTSPDLILDTLQSPFLGGGIPFVIIRDAHFLKNPELLAAAFDQPSSKTELASLCICLAKDLDGRKKFSKLLLEKTAVIACENVPESQKEVWIQFLAKRHQVTLQASVLAKLCALEPWTLDRISQELEKFSISDQSLEVILDSNPTFAALGGSEAFLEALFSKQKSAAFQLLSAFANDPEISLPLLGLLTWHLRQLALLITDRRQGTRFTKLNAYSGEQLIRWSHHWTLEDLIDLQTKLSELDYSLKQTPLTPLGLWSELFF